MRALSIAVVVLLLVVSCASVGGRFRVDALPQLQPGKTTEAEAIQLLGSKPYQRTQHANGSRLLVWVHTQALLAHVESRAVSIWFDDKGVMLGFHRGVNVNLPESALASATSGRRLGVWFLNQLPNGDFTLHVSRIQEGSLAEAAQWKVGDIILAIDGKPLGTVSELIVETQQGGRVKTYTLRRGERVIESQIEFPDVQ